MYHKYNKYVTEFLQHVWGCFCFVIHIMKHIIELSVNMQKPIEFDQTDYNISYTRRFKNCCVSFDCLNC